MDFSAIAAALTPKPRKKADRSFGYNLADNIMGIDDGVETPGERAGKGIGYLASGLANDPVGMIGGAASAIKGDLDNLMFEGGAMERPEAVLGYAAAPMAPGARGLMRNVPNEVNAIKAYHGSPHDFDKFSMDKIGTGEGAQAYGHGLYFAENEAVARGYRDALSSYSQPVEKQIFSKTNASELYRGLSVEDAATLDQIMGTIEGAPGLSRARIDVEEFPERGLQLFEERIAPLLTDPPTGSMYEVSIDADPADFLDWDAPLSAQSLKIQEMARTVPTDDLMSRPRMKFQKWRDGTANELEMPTGRDLRNAFTDYGDNADGNASFTQTLSRQGIPGIKYKDAGSRGIDGDGTRNYVVFDENLINIVKKYGVAGAATMLGMTAAEVEAGMAQNQPKQSFGYNNVGAR